MTGRRPTGWQHWRDWERWQDWPAGEQGQDWRGQDWQANRPPQVQVWWWGAGPQRRPSDDVAARPEPTSVRIGDAERDRALADLGDHFAAGRLTREEFDERADRAMQAKFNGDLEPLFADLPKAGGGDPQPQVGRRVGGPPPWAYALWLLPFLLVAAVAGAVLLHAPFLIWLAVWLIVVGKITGHRRHYRRQQLRR